MTPYFIIFHDPPKHRDGFHNDTGPTSALRTINKDEHHLTEAYHKPQGNSGKSTVNS